MLKAHLKGELSPQATEGFGSRAVPGSGCCRGFYRRPLAAIDWSGQGLPLPGRFASVRFMWALPTCLLERIANPSVRIAASPPFRGGIHRQTQGSPERGAVAESD